MGRGSARPTAKRPRLPVGLAEPRPTLRDLLWFSHHDPALSRLPGRERYRSGLPPLPGRPVAAHRRRGPTRLPCHARPRRPPRRPTRNGPRRNSTGRRRCDLDPTPAASGHAWRSSPVTSPPPRPATDGRPRPQVVNPWPPVDSLHDRCNALQAGVRGVTQRIRALARTSRRRPLAPPVGLSRNPRSGYRVPVSSTGPARGPGLPCASIAPRILLPVALAGGLLVAQEPAPRRPAPRSSRCRPGGRSTRTPTTSARPSTSFPPTCPAPSSPGRSSRPRTRSRPANCPPRPSP